MPKLKVEAPGVELKCILCPKNPSFSDLSHLLTHIASKSHLANKFKLEVESRHQAEAKNKLDDFEFWYNTNNLDEMLSDRMVAKEDKRKRKTRATSVKQEFNSHKKQDENSDFRAPSASMHSRSSRADIFDSAVPGEPERSIYSTPTARSKVPNFSDHETLDGNQIDPMLTTPWKLDLENDEILTNSVPKNPGSDSARLKGIQWPGMRVFDAATPEGKRMRNQRKDSKVLRDMMATSRGVEPAEISYHANGDFRGSRDIFGPLSAESSPIQTKRSSPKKRKVRKPTFHSMSTNGPRPRQTRTKKDPAPTDPHKNIVLPNNYRQSVFSQPPPTLNPLATGSHGPKGRRYMPVVEEDEEYKLTIGNFENKKAFGVFEDEASPSRTESPLEEPRFEFPQSHGLPMWSNNSLGSAHIPPSPTPASKPVPRDVGSLNGIGASSSNHGQQENVTHVHARRTLSDSHLFTPHAFLHDFNPLFNQSNNVFNRSLGNYGSQYLYGGHPTNHYVENNHMNGTSSGYGSNFIGDFRQLNPMANASINHLQGQSLNLVADMGVGNNENEMPFM